MYWSLFGRTLLEGWPLWTKIQKTPNKPLLLIRPRKPLGFMRPFRAGKPNQHRQGCGSSHWTPMEFSKHSLEIVPPDWTGYLDASSFLALQCAHVSCFSDAQCIESFWCNLCRNQLRSVLATSGPPADIYLDANSIKHSLTRRGRGG